MTIRIPGTNTGPFGGPQGSTLQAMMQLMQGYLMGEKKAEEQKQMDLLGKIFGQQTRGGQPDEMGGTSMLQPISRENIIEQILSNRELKPKTRMLGIRAAQALPRYTTEKPDYMILKYWDKNGNPRSKRVLATDYNKTVDKIASKGGTFEDPDKLTGNAANFKTLMGRNPTLEELQAMKGQTSLTVNPDGTVSFTQGAINPNLPKPVQTDLTKKFISTNEGLARLGSILQSYKPQYQEIPERMGYKWTELKEKWGVGEIKPEAVDSLNQFENYRMSALDNINLMIKEMTGAQMSQQEADRLRKGMPDPGEGIFDGDAPSVFQAKLLKKYKDLQAVQMRTAYYLKNGVTAESLKDMINKNMVMSIERFEQMVEEKGKQYEREIKARNPNITTADLFSQVKARLTAEFGIRSNR